MKKLLGIVVLLFIFSNFSEAKIIHLKCDFDKVTFYLPDKSDEDRNWSRIYSFDLSKKRLLEIDYKKNVNHPLHGKPVNLVVNESEIAWLYYGLSDDKQKKYFKWSLGLENSEIWLHHNKINRYTGEIENNYHHMDMTVFLQFHNLAIPFYKMEKNFEKVMIDEKDKEPKKAAKSMTGYGKCAEIKKEKKF